MIRSLSIFSCTMAVIASLSPCLAHSRPGLEFRRASTGEIYFQPTPPLTPKEGELWVDSRNGNQFYFLNGAWAFEDLGTTIASNRSEQANQMAASDTADNETTRDTKLVAAHHDSKGTNHNQQHSAPTALHEPRPLTATMSPETNSSSSNDQPTFGATATTVTQATFGSSNNNTKKPASGLDDKNARNAAQSKSDGPHMSLTDALNADELVNLLRAIGANH